MRAEDLGAVLCYAASEVSACELAFNELGADEAEDCVATRESKYDWRCKEKLVAYIESDSEWQRNEGWALENEQCCDACGLAPMGLEAFGVCRVCNMCKVCGHDDDHEDGPCPNDEGFSFGG